MWLAIFGLVCFWSSVAGLVAHLLGWWELPAILGIGVLATLVLSLIGCMCRVTGDSHPDERPIELQTYFGGTFKVKSAGDGVRLQP